MAIIAVQTDRPVQRDEVNKTDQLLDRIAKGLSIASNIYGIKTQSEQSDLRKIQQQKLEQEMALAESKEARTQAEFEKKPSETLTQAEFNKQYIEVDKPQFEEKYGSMYPLTQVNVGQQGDIKWAVDKDALKAISDIRQKESKKSGLLAGGQTIKDSIGLKKSDEAFGREYGKYISEGSEAKTFDLINKLDVLVDDAEKNLSGGWDEQVMGLLPGGFRDVFDPEDKAIEDRLKAVAQKSLRETLGAQFTEKEGKMILDRAFNPSQPKAENIRRMRELTNSIRQQATAKKSAMDYFAEYGTLQGFKAPITQPLTTSTAREAIADKSQKSGLRTLMGGFAPSQPALLDAPESDDDFVNRYLNK
jgi:hypothetical protein